MQMCFIRQIVANIKKEMSFWAHNPLLLAAAQPGL